MRRPHPAEPGGNVQIMKPSWRKWQGMHMLNYWSFSELGQMGLDGSLSFRSSELRERTRSGLAGYTWTSPELMGKKRGLEESRWIALIICSRHSLALAEVLFCDVCHPTPQHLASSITAAFLCRWQRGLEFPEHSYRLAWSSGEAGISHGLNMAFLIFPVKLFLKPVCFSLAPKHTQNPLY